MIDDSSPRNESFDDQQQAAVYRDDLVEKGTVLQLLNRAKHVIASGETSLCTSLREAPELIAAAQKQGASQQKIADAQAGERENAALATERLRQGINLSWDQLIIAGRDSSSAERLLSEAIT